MPLDQGREIRWALISNYLPAYRFVFMVSLIIFLAGIVIKVYQKYKVNYLFILEIDLNDKKSSIEILRLGVMLMTFWCLCFFGDLCIVKYEYYFIKTPALFTALMYTILISLILLPCLLRKTGFGFIVT